MKRLFLSFIFFGAAVGFAQNNTVSIKAEPYNTSGKKEIVYTTAHSSFYRLSPTDTVTFKKMGQPFETQICVFVDPSKTFQTILGIAL